MFQIRYGEDNYQEMRKSKWQWVCDKGSNKISTFANKEKARQYIRNHLSYSDRTEIVGVNNGN